MARSLLNRWLTLALLAWLPAGVSAQQLGRVRDVKELKPEQAAQSLPVHLHGTVTALSGWKNSFFLQDASGAISVDRTDEAPVLAGDEVEITGVTGPGKFAPVVLASRVQVIGRGRPPVPKPASYRDLATGRLDSEWVEVEGIVREAAVSEDWGRRVLFLTLSVDGAPIAARVHGFKDANFKRLEDAKVRLRGACGTIFNDRRQLMGVRLFVPDLDRGVQVEEGAPADPFQAPELAVNSLFHYVPAQRLEHRVRVQATLVYRDVRRHQLYLQEGSDGLIVRAAGAVADLREGMGVEAVGFVAAGQYPAVLENALVRKAGREASKVVPVTARAAEVITKKDGFAYAPVSGQLVRVEGVLIEKTRHPGEDTWLMRDGNEVFRAVIDREIEGGRLEKIAAGSRVALTGICQVETDRSLAPQSFTILLRDPADVEMLETAWREGSRMLWLTGALIVVCVCLLAWVFQTRKAAAPKESDAKAPVIRSRPAVDLAHGCGVFSVLLGLVVLIFGWYGDMEVVRTLVAGSASMKPATAVGLVLAGYALCIAGRSAKANAWSSAIGASMILIVGTSGFSYYVLKSGQFLGGIPAPTVICLLLVGTSLLLIEAERTVTLAQVLACAAIVPCLLNLVGQIYGVKNFFGHDPQQGLAIHSSIGFLAVCAGLLALRSDSGLMATITSRSPGGTMARRLIPAAVVVPIVLGWLRWQGELFGLYDTRSGLGLYNVSNIVVFAFLIWASAGWLNRSDKDRRLIELRLADSERRHRTVIESLPQIVWTGRADGSWDYVSPKRTEVTGVPVDEQLGHGWLEQIHPEDRERIRRLWDFGKQSGKPLDTEYRIRDASGTYRWFRSMAVPIRNSDGEVGYWFGSCTDIEDYKRSQAAIVALNENLEHHVEQRTAQVVQVNQDLAQAQAWLQGILDAATEVAVIATDLNQTILLFNAGAEKMLQYSADELVARCTPEVFHLPAEIENRSALLSLQYGRPVRGADVLVAGLLEGRPEQRDWTYVRKDGSTLDVSITVSCRYDPDGQLMGYLAIAIDITARKNLDRQLLEIHDDLVEQTRKAQEASRAKSDFLASMSHEIRTPMNAILGMADLLWDSELTQEQRHYVELFRGAGSNLLTLINDILDHSKIEAGHLELERVEFDLEDVVNEAVELVSQKARAKELALLVRIAPGLTATLRVGDPTRTRQVLINLLGNAIKFTDSGEIVLSVEEAAGGFIGFGVRDTGIGIAEEKLGTIFADFAQADSSTTRKYGGTGLGLAISRRIAEKMGGSLTVTSNLGEGSTFHFRAELPRGQARSQTAVARPGSFRGERALIVDDNATHRMILRETLQGWEFEVDDTGNPAEALEAVRARSYSVILLDNRMPRMDGFELAARIREIPSQVPLMMLTSDNLAGDLAKRAATGLAGYAMKPVRRSELLRQLGLMLASKTEAPAIETASSPAAPARTGAVADGVRPLEILIAEDGESNRDVLRAYFKKTSHRLTFVENGEFAVRTFAENREKFDIVLMDMHMPVMDGRSATREIRALEVKHGLTAIPIIAVTANARNEDIQMSREAGCSHHLSKPLSKQTLFRTLEEYAGRRLPQAQATPKIELPEDEDLLELVPGYVEDRLKDVAGMMELLSAADYDRLWTLGHELKGTGTSYGLPDLTKMGADFEKAARRKNEAEIGAQIRQLADYLKRVQTTLGVTQLTR